MTRGLEGLVKRGKIRQRPPKTALTRHGGGHLRPPADIAEHLNIPETTARPTQKMRDSESPKTTSELLKAERPVLPKQSVLNHVLVQDDFPDRVRTVRRNKGWSTAFLARQAGASLSFIENAEAGEFNLENELAAGIAADPAKVLEIAPPSVA
jgi:ribosome-binding protein aMBF1 (putative translation factor)